MLFVHFYALGKVKFSVGRVAEAGRWHDRLGVAHQCQVGVINQWQNGMGIRRGGDFDHTCILQLLVQRNDLADQLQDAIKKNGLVFFTKIAAFLYQGFERFLG